MESRRRRWCQLLGHWASPVLFPTHLGTHWLPLLTSAVKNCVLFSWLGQTWWACLFDLTAPWLSLAAPSFMSQQRPPPAPSLVHTQTFLLWPQKQASWFPSQLLPCPQEIRGTYESILYHKAINYILSLYNHTKPPHVSFRVCARIHFCRPHSLAFHPHPQGQKLGERMQTGVSTASPPLLFSTVHWLQRAFIYSPSCLACIRLQHILHIPFDFHSLIEDDGTVIGGEKGIKRYYFNGFKIADYLHKFNQ